MIDFSRKVFPFLLITIAAAGMTESPLRAEEVANQEKVAQDAAAPRREGRSEASLGWWRQLETRLPDLSDEQKATIRKIYGDTEIEMNAARENGSLAPEERRNTLQRLREQVDNNIQPVLTEAQRTRWKQTEDSRERTTRDRAVTEGEAPRQTTPRILRRYVSVLPDLTAEQKTQILAMYEETRVEQEAIRKNEELTEEKRTEELQRVLNAFTERSLTALTPEQRAKWLAMVEARRQAELQREFNLRPGETLAQKQTRVLAPYISAISNLTPEQKGLILPLAEEVNDVLDELDRDDSRTEAEKNAVRRRVKAASTTKIGALLTKEQLAQWQKSTEPAKPVKPAAKVGAGKPSQDKTSAGAAVSKKGPQNR